MSFTKWKRVTLPTAAALGAVLACSDERQSLAPVPLAHMVLPPSYSVLDISPGPDGSQASGINDAGAVVGWSFTSTGTHAWMRDGRRVIWLKEPRGASGSEAFAIAGNGSISGSVTFPGTGGEPVYWPGAHKKPRVIPLPGGLSNGSSLGVNNLGQVVGTFYDAASLSHAFLWSEATNTTIDLGTLGGLNAGATDINDRGEVVGCAELASGALRAYRWTSSGGMVELAPFYARSCAEGINELGDASGWVNPGSADTSAVFVTAGVSHRYLAEAELLDLNDSLIAVGFQRVGTQRNAVAIDEFATWTTLPTLSAGAKSTAQAINSAGVIVGYEKLAPPGPSRAVMWRP
jgi:probable HAF family extracellular repeat protein